VPYQAAEQFGIFGQLAQLNLNEGKALLERGELLEELLLGGFLFRGNAIVLVVSAYETFHDDAPFGSSWVVYLQVDLRLVSRTVARSERTPRRPDVYSTTSFGFSVTGLDML
jgi:hypothetical protein